LDFKHFEDPGEFDKHSNIACRVTRSTTFVRQAFRHQPLQVSSPIDSDKYKPLSKSPTNLNSPSTISTIMGQRHQFFAIARINNRYRTLAVVHNQWLYGHSAVRQCLQTMRVLSATGNLQGIRRDLKLAESKPESFWEAKPRARGDEQGRVSSSSHLWECCSRAAYI
jgi:hypothetical protein